MASLGKNVFYNSYNYYTKLKEFIESMVEKEFLSKEDYELISFFDTTI